MVSLMKIKNTLHNIDGDGWDGYTVNYLDDAINSLTKLAESLNNVNVHGRTNLDALLGCMMGLDMIIGEGEDDG